MVLALLVTTAHAFGMDAKTALDFKRTTRKQLQEIIHLYESLEKSENAQYWANTYDKIDELLPVLKEAEKKYTVYSTEINYIVTLDIKYEYKSSVMLLIAALQKHGPILDTLDLKKIAQKEVRSPDSSHTRKQFHTIPDGEYCDLVVPVKHVFGQISEQKER